jgi:hypothetical protein
MLSKKSSAWQNGCVLTRLVSRLTQWSPAPERRNAMVRIFCCRLSIRHADALQKTALYTLAVTVTTDCHH